ncbi:hypothetical protein FIA58_004040 [Flavobacterium jejuense]|uniref:DUF6265 domain-containing protein n=1 Tax=Flavobacterium jejuense TaxID=1544455 RepID=A0ABX0ISM9_9FLAO|nr:DUF6265 family protein [Flavobacterium jejuense]NHN24840.1 hypothetical protein [Flavobacterium jejuense]
MKTKFFITMVGMMVLCAYTMKEPNDINKAKWLIGTWENKTPKGIIYETWNKSNDSQFSGKSYIIKEKDTIIFENIQLVQKQDGLFYIPIVKNQNSGLPVRFVSKIISETELVFENLQHDFPQIISYKKINSDSLVAEISGTKNGQKRRQTFPMKRVK